MVVEVSRTGSRKSTGELSATWKLVAQCIARCSDTCFYPDQNFQFEGKHDWIGGLELWHVISVIRPLHW